MKEAERRSGDSPNALDAKVTPAIGEGYPMIWDS
jgi:hypothetical protein